MSNNLQNTKNFQFKKFAINGGQCGMPVSTDGVLLGAWIDLTDIKRILDIGTGTGLLALMCAQRKLEMDIHAVDIDTNATAAAQLNVLNSPWSQRIRVELADILTATDLGEFDGIICNPPYFNSGEQSQSKQRATARHTDSLSHQALLQCCQSLLNEQGRASFILPVVEGEAFITLAQQLGFFVSRLCRIKPTETKAENRLLIELSKQESQCQPQQLTIRDKLGYSEGFIALTKDFYLKM
ncbi:methyltransferase [Vibrio sp. 404]|uniref:tRNA1(Val) (adenine(37)-N6)-methyltransferase n=1 Tax=Vibrio marinisediminis TaxID=2758441 RepID=A0A7W2FTH1_9VIBR|nr:methyltransferase [Vibrio marinisediminis]MBA5763920.1 methyltransferase [Vibrio marinisediminis]